MTFARRRIRLSFILGEGNFGEQGQRSPVVIENPKNQATLPVGLRIKVHISRAGGNQLGFAEITVAGVTPELLDQLTTVAQFDMFQRHNTVIVEAGDDIDGLSVIFQGTIKLSFADFTAAPESKLHVSAVAESFALVKPIEPTSYPRSAAVSVVIAGLANQMSYAFENNGVTTQLRTPYFTGSTIDQIRKCAEAARIDYTIDDTKKTVAIWLPGFGRNGNNAVVKISAQTGMVGYPMHTGTGMIVKMLMNRDVAIGGIAEVASLLRAACGKFWIIAVTHDIESETPRGMWFTQCQLATLGNPHAEPALK